MKTTCRPLDCTSATHWLTALAAQLDPEPGDLLMACAAALANEPGISPIMAVAPMTAATQCVRRRIGCSHADHFHRPTPRPAQVAGDEEEQHDETQQHDGRPEAALDEARLTTSHRGEDVERQRVHRVLERVGVEEGRCPRGDQDRSGLTDCSGHSEDDGRGQAGPRGRQDDPPYRLPLGGAEREACLPQAAGDDPERNVGRARDDRQHHHRQGHRRGEASPLEAEGEDQHRVDEQASQDVGQCGHRLDDGPHDSGKPSADLDHEHGRPDAERERDRGRDSQLDRASRPARA